MCLVDCVGGGGTTAALLTFVILVERFCVETFVVRGLPWHNAYVEDLVDYATISITLLVVAVPEGLPLAVVLALAVSIKVRRLSVSTGWICCQLDQSSGL